MKGGNKKESKKVADILKKFEKKTCQIAFHVVLLMSFLGVTFFIYGNAYKWKAS